MSKYICNLRDIDSNNIDLIGGKGANLVELSQIRDIKVPNGFCITVDAYKEVYKSNDNIKVLINELKKVNPDRIDSIKDISKKIRDTIEQIEFPEVVLNKLNKQLSKYNLDKAFAVRSSATAEDLPTTSFAGQHDTYLNVIGKDSIINSIKKCWASLFTERAIIYRNQNEFEHDKVYLSVVIQEMIDSTISGVMFTADPNTSNRKVLSIDASYGLGEAIVSGLVSPDNYKVRDEKIIKKIISSKNNAIRTLSNGGINEEVVNEMSKKSQALEDEKILELAKLGRQIEKHFSLPQDIEWCIKDGEIFIVQSRPITTLYPIPKVENGENRVFFSSGHLQMMTAPVKPLGIYFFRSVISNPPSQVIGGRLYCDITHDLASPIGRIIVKNILGVIGDSLLTDSIAKVIKDKKYIRTLKKGKDKVIHLDNNNGGLSVLFHAYKIYKENNPDIIKGFMDDEQKSIDDMEAKIKTLSGADVFDFIYQDHEGRRSKLMQPVNAGAMATVMLANMWFSRKIKKLLGIENAADTIIQSIPNSVTSDTGLALLDVADVVRKHPDVVEYFKNANDKTFFDDISKLDGGEQVCSSIKEYLNLYGMRCSGDIDITVPRWSEEPTKLIPIIMNNINNFEPNYRQKKYEDGLNESNKIISSLLEQVEKLPRGKSKAKRIKKVASLIRNYIGYREYPKFSYIKRYFIYKQALLKEASKLLEKGIIKEIEDVYYLYFDEFKEVVRTQELDYEIIVKRKIDYKSYKKLTPQRVITSDGDVIESEYNKADYPEGALIGVPVSSGIIEGRARVISNMEETDLEEGDILVTEFTDPSWTPLFVSIKGLVTEVGGLTTHGAVISREYGLPAVVSVENVTKLVKDGQRIRLDGSKGYIEILS
jgi:pyruvate,water dikinase